MSVRGAIRSVVSAAQDRGIELARLSLLRAAEFDLRGSSAASAASARWFVVAVVAAWLAGPNSDHDGSATDADLHASDLDESDAASCASEGTGGLVVDVTAAATDDEGLHEEEGSARRIVGANVTIDRKMMR